MRILREAIKYIDSLHNQLVQQSNLSGSSQETVSLIQRALQPGIEAKLDEKRKLDKIAEQSLWEAATSGTTDPCAGASNQSSSSSQEK